MLSARGPLETGRGVDALGGKLNDLLADGVRRIVIDLQMKKMGKFDSAGIGLVVTLLLEASRWGGVLAFAGVPRKVLDALVITQVASAWPNSSGAPLIPLFETVEEAVGAVLEAMP